MKIKLAKAALRVSVCVAMLCFATAQTQAGVIIGFEGAASPGSYTSESNTTRVFSGFSVFLRHGHYVDSNNANVGAGWADNGTDYLLNDQTLGITITSVNNSLFSAQSFDASEYHVSFGRNRPIFVSGVYGGGGSISQSFTSDNVWGFETLMLSPGFTNLRSLTIRSSSSRMAWDNISLNNTPTVPEPSTLAIFGAIGLVACGRRRKSS